MHIVILTPEKQMFDGKAVSIQLPGVDGLFEVLQNHAPFISALQEGVIRLKTDDNQKRYSIKGGFVEVLNNHVSVLVEGGKELA